MICFLLCKPFTGNEDSNLSIITHVQIHNNPHFELNKKLTRVDIKRVDYRLI